MLFEEAPGPSRVMELIRKITPLLWKSSPHSIRIPSSFSIVNNVFISWRSRRRTSLSPGLKPAVCENKISSASWGSSFSLSLTDWIPVKTPLLPLPTQLLLVHRHRLHLRAHTGCMRYQVRGAVMQGHAWQGDIFISGGGGAHRYSFLSSLPWLTRCCAKTRGSELWLRVCTLTCIISEALRWLKKTHL